MEVIGNELHYFNGVIHFVLIQQIMASRIRAIDLLPLLKEKLAYLSGKMITFNVFICNHRVLTFTGYNINLLELQSAEHMRCQSGCTAVNLFTIFFLCRAML